MHEWEASTAERGSRGEVLVVVGEQGRVLVARSNSEQGIVTEPSRRVCDARLIGRPVAAGAVDDACGEDDRVAGLVVP